MIVSVTKLGYDKFLLLFVSKLNIVLGKPCETPQGLHYAYSYKSKRSILLNKKEFLKLLCVYSSQGSFTGTAKSSLKKNVFLISKRNIYKSVTS